MKKRVCLLFLFVLVSAAIFNYGAIPASERAALIALYNYTDGDHWRNNNGWKTPPLAEDGFAMPGTENNWSGITISNETVTMIFLSSNRLNGPIPPELGNLSNLQTLGLLNNQLSGALPPELEMLSNLKDLDLQENRLSGPIPPQLGNLSNIQTINLSSNLLSGTLPPQLGNLSNLRIFNLSSNQISGSIPPGLNTLSNLEECYLKNNYLSGSIPSELELLYNLIVLDISYNQLSGTIPPQLGNLPNLAELELSYNQLSGPIPLELCKVSNFFSLELNSNQLSGTIPPQLGNLKYLHSLGLYENRLHGPIPSELGNLSNLTYLWLTGNQLSGIIPPELGNLYQLKDLSLDHNQLSGSIPATLAKLSRLEYLWLNSNQLSGSIPSELANLPSLYRLYLDHNLLSGVIPSALGNLSHLKYLYLGYNSFIGFIPIELGKLSNLRFLYLDHNYLVGNIPLELAKLSRLNSLYLADNKLKGEIPSGLARLIKVKNLDIGHNCLFTNDPTLKAWLYKRQPNWQALQDKCYPQPEINLNRTFLNYGSTLSGAATPPQTVVIKNTGVGVLSWTAVSNTSWLIVSPGSGTGPGILTISINPSGLPVGTHTSFITVTDPDAGNSPQNIVVTLRIYDNGFSAAPFGDFATPVNGSVVSGSIPVTGWVLDDIEVKKVEIFRDTSYIGDAVFIEGARPDVEEAYPGYPQNYKAGWGYMLLTNFFPNGGNGTYILFSIATDVVGNQVIFSSKTITCNNAYAVEPFGTIDTPTQGGIASGENFVNQGWVLTQQPNIIEVNGSAIDVWVDGVKKGHPAYNILRADIADFFPGYANSNGAGGEFHLDTTYFKNGVHTIHWTAIDNSGNSAGIGSRYFTIENSGGSLMQESDNDAVDMPFAFTLKDLESLPGQSAAPGKVIKGYGKDDEVCEYELFPDEDGINRVSIKELERIEIQMGENLSDVADVRGYMIIDGGLRSLPIGSTLDKKAGKFYWSPGPGFYGKYHLVFLIKDNGGQWSKKMIEINIGSKYDLND
ncbi:MAG: Ig-like domain-containing protein [Candidatus Aminicenantes bacterium]|nr:Ig-like domain-containing protein [Candidatus Aminicenantes bacterium]